MGVRFQLWIQWISWGKTTKASLKITDWVDLLTFLVCKSSTNEPQTEAGSRSKRPHRWVVQQGPHRRGFKVDELVDWLIKYNQVRVSYRLSIDDVLFRSKNSYQSLVSKQNAWQILYFSGQQLLNERNFQYGVMAHRLWTLLLSASTGSNMISWKYEANERKTKSFI